MNYMHTAISNIKKAMIESLPDSVTVGIATNGSEMLEIENVPPAVTLWLPSCNCSSSRIVGIGTPDEEFRVIMYINSTYESEPNSDESDIFSLIEKIRNTFLPAGGFKPLNISSRLEGGDWILIAPTAASMKASITFTFTVMSNMNRESAV